MPYAPNVSYRGDAFLSQGIQNAGEGIAAAIANYRKAKEESDFLDQQVVGLAAAAKPLLESGAVDPALTEQLSKFPELSLSKKRGVAASALFQIQQAQQQQRERADQEDRQLRRGAEYGRLTMEAARFNRESADASRKQQFNVGLSDYLNTPESIRRPMREAVPALAAQAGIATPAMMGEMDDARLREVDLNIRERAVGVQEGNLRVREEAANTPKPRKLSVTEVKMLDNLRGQRSRIQEELDAAEAELAKGNKRKGPDWGWGGKFQDASAAARKRLEDLNKRIGDLEGPDESSKPAVSAETPKAEKPAEQPDQELNAAMQAIQAGADPAAVEALYRKRTGKPLPW